MMIFLLMGLSMRGNAMDYINSYIAKKFDDKFYIGLITKKKGDLWHVEYEDGNKEDSDAIEVEKGIQLYYFALDIDGKPSELLL